MRLSKIENPEHSEVLKAFEKSKLFFGKVITPLKVTYARVPKSIKISTALNDYSFSDSVVDKNILTYVKGITSITNNCKFCIDIARAEFNNNEDLLSKYDNLSEYNNNEDSFLPNELAAIKYAEEVTKNKIVSEQTFDNLSKYFNETEIVEITISCAIENYYNIMNLCFEIESDNLSKN